MRRLIVANLLVFAVLASAAALAYYGWRYNARAASDEQRNQREILHELAVEKINNFEDRVVQADRRVFDGIHIDQPPQVDKDAPLISLFILDADLHLMPSGYYSKRVGDPGNAFRDRFLSRILPELPLRSQPIGERGHVHDVLDGEEFLFAFTHRYENGRDFYVVLETDLKYLVVEYFQAFFSGGGKLYQVVDENGELVYGPPFTTRGIVVEVGFEDTLDKWRVRAAQRDVVGEEDRGKRKLIDLVLVALALAGLAAGIGVLMLAMYRERKANDLKSDFISNVSHELKTPLSIISMFGEMLALERVKTPEQAKEYADIIWRESVRLARLIDNVLDFAKIERGKDVYEFAEGDVAAVVLRAIELSQHRLQKAEMVVETHLSEDLPPASIDANAYTLAVMNLIDNAIKYAPEGKRLDIRLGAIAGRIVLEVQDQGPGIDPAEHTRIFERFYRAHAIRLKPIRGSGIGLALVDHIARAHGGGTWVASALGKGATFGLWIPLAR